MKFLKKALAFLCVSAMLISTCVVANAVETERTFKVRIEKDGEVVTDATTLAANDEIDVIYSYEGFVDPALNYVTTTKMGNRLSGIQFKGTLPGVTTEDGNGYFTPVLVEDEDSGESVPSITIDNAYSSNSNKVSSNLSYAAAGDATFTCPISFGAVAKSPRTTSHDIIKVTLKVLKTIDKSLTFGFDDAYDTKAYMVAHSGSTTGTTSQYQDMVKESATLTAGSSTVAVTGVTLSETAKTVTKGDADFTLTATVTPDNATNTNVTWTSSNEEVAKVNNGVVSIIGVGKATIKVTTEDGNFEATCDVTVKEPARANVVIKDPKNGGILDPNNAESYQFEGSDGDAVAFIADVTPLNGNTLSKLTWTVTSGAKTRDDIVQNIKGAIEGSAVSFGLIITGINTVSAVSAVAE